VWYSLDKLNNKKSGKHKKEMMDISNIKGMKMNAGKSKKSDHFATEMWYSKNIVFTVQNIATVGTGAAPAWGI